MLVSLLSLILSTPGKDDEALNVYMEALELCPENPELLTTVGLLFLKLGNNTKAFEFLGNSLTYDPRSAKTILAAGSIIQDNQVRAWCMYGALFVLAWVL